MTKAFVKIKNRIAEFISDIAFLTKYPVRIVRSAIWVIILSVLIQTVFSAVLNETCAYKETGLS